MKNKLNIIYAGTPQFAVPPLEILAKSNFLISCVLTQPDKRAGRGMKIIKVDNCPDDPFTCSDVETMLDYLKNEAS